MTELKLIGGKRHLEWVNTPDGVQEFRVPVRKHDGCFTTNSDVFESGFDVERYAIVPNKHFTGFAEGFLIS